MKGVEIGLGDGCGMRRGGGDGGQGLDIEVE